MSFCLLQPELELTPDLPLFFSRSPALVNYSGSPYNAPAQLQQEHGGQGCPPAGFSPSSSLRGGNAEAHGGIVTLTKMSPANLKRSSNLEHPSPWSRKRGKHGGKDDGGVPGGAPETPRFDRSGPPSSGTGMPMQGQVSFTFGSEVKGNPS